MNYYPFHIGDYASHTRGLSLLEDLAYRRLMDEYYLAERPLNGCSTDVARLIGMAEHEREVAYVLSRYFTETDGDWVHERIENELAAFKNKQEKASAAGKASAESRKNKGKRTDVQQTFNGCSTDVQRPSTNQEPRTNISTTDVVDKRKSATPAKPDDVSQSVWDDFLAIRRAKKSPLGTTALHGIEREAAKAGLSLEAALSMCCSRGWQSFKADWVKEDGKAGQKQTTRNGAAMASYGTIFPTTQEGQGNGRTIDATPRLG